MTPKSPSDAARDDLAFMRALVDPPGRFQRSFGEAYFAAGLCYGVQMLLHAAQQMGWIAPDGLTGLLVGLGPTVVFLALLAAILVRRRREPAGGGTVSRAVAALFGAAGTANLALLLAIGSLAWRERSIEVWLLFPCVVLILQGMAWMVVYALRRRAWYAVVAMGWLVTGVAMAFAIGHVAAFIGIAGFGFIAFMLVPGWVLMRQAEPG